MKKGLDLEGLGFVTPPENQGQIVIVGYALKGDAEPPVVIRRTEDTSLPSDHPDRIVYDWARAPEDDEGDYWNGPPRVDRWRRLT
jgi:hypothetical protein